MKRNFLPFFTFFVLFSLAISIIFLHAKQVNASRGFEPRSAPTFLKDYADYPFFYSFFD